MKVKAAAEPPEWTPVLELVETILVSVELEPAEAKQRVNLWMARQHLLEGQALETLLPGMEPADADLQLLRWSLEGHANDEDLRASAVALGILLDPDPPFS